MYHNTVTLIRKPVPQIPRHPALLLYKEALGIQLFNENTIFKEHELSNIVLKAIAKWQHHFHHQIAYFLWKSHSYKLYRTSDLTKKDSGLFQKIILYKQVANSNINSNWTELYSFYVKKINDTSYEDEVYFLF